VALFLVRPILIPTEEVTLVSEPRLPQLLYDFGRIPFQFLDWCQTEHRRPAVDGPSRHLQLLPQADVAL
jgi:hypothetical protein